MKKEDFVAKVSRITGVNRKDSHAVIDSFIEVLKNAVKKEESVNITGFGTFSVSTRKEHNGRNPLTGETIVVPEKKVIKFAPYKAFKDLVNE